MLIANDNPVSDEANDVYRINTSHLEKLYHVVVTPGGNVLGVIDIYLAAPDYNLVFDEAEGFTCIDDIARAIVFYCRRYKRNPESGHIQKILSLSNTLFYMQSDNGYFYNFIFPDLSINSTHINSTATPNFWSWRAMWALSEILILNSPQIQNIIPRANKAIKLLIDNLISIIEKKERLIEYDGITISKFVGQIGADQIAVIIGSLTNCFVATPKDQYRKLILKLGNALLYSQVGNENMFPHFAFLSWKNIWHAWGNCQSAALQYSGNILANNDFIQAGIKEVQYFYPYLIRNNFLNKFEVRLINGNIKCFDKEQFPQISYDIRAMVFATLFAYKTTNDIVFAHIAADIVMWLFGNNPANSIIYDGKTGRCYDGIDSKLSVNKNSGAESTIEALLILNEVENFPFIIQLLEELIKTKDYE